MLSDEETGHCRALIGLAEGFMDTARITAESSEHEVRNALSRSYYGVFHSCRAWLLSKEIPAKKSQAHKRVQLYVGTHRGAAYADRLRDFYRLRQDSDYRPGMLEAAPYNGDLAKFRAIAETKVNSMRTEFDWYASEARRIVSP